MDIDSLKVFAEVAKLGSFSKAAKSLHLSSTATSAKVQKLEAILAVRLFDRTTRAVQLTQIGEQILQHALQVLLTAEDISNLAASQAEEPRGLLRICTMQTMGTMIMGDWVIEFRQRYPKVEIELLYSNEALDLQQHHLDFGFRQKSLPNSNLIARKLVDQSWSVVATPAFLADSPSINQPEDLHQVNTIGIIGESQDAIWRFKKGTRQVQFHPKNCLSFEDPILSHRAVMADLGASFLPEFLTAEDLASGKLVELIPDWRTAPENFYLIYVGNKNMSAKNRCFIDFVLEKFALVNEESLV